MENNSGLHPAGRAVLVKPYQPEIKQGTIIIPDAVMANQQVLEQRAVVIETGPVSWWEERKRFLFWKLKRGGRARVGDKVLVSAYAGYMAKGIKDGEQYRFVNDRDIFARIEE